MSKMMPPKKNLPTLADVAKLAGVSKAVASRSLSGKDRPVAKEKKQRVLEAAKQLGYVANPFAKSLVNQETGLIAIVVNHITDISDLNLFDLLLQAIQSIGKQTLFIRLQSKEHIDNMRTNSFVHRVDAALIFSDLIKPDIARSLFLTDQVVMLNGMHNAESLSVIIDENTAIEQAVEHASAQGLEQAILIGGRQSSPAEQARIACFTHNMEAQSMQLNAQVWCDYSYQQASDYLATLPAETLSSHALFCTSDAMAMAAIDCLSQHGIKKNSHIYGFDNTQFAHLGHYQFATIGYDKQIFIDTILQLITPQPTQQETNLSIATQFYPLPAI